MPRDSVRKAWYSLGSWFRDWWLPDRFEAVRILPETVQDICALAKGAHPKEMVAFLTGEVRVEDGRRTLIIEGLYVKSYDADERSTHFTTHDLPMLHVWGTVHSHPGWSNRPSDADLQLFNKEGWLHLIICRPYTGKAIAAYDKYGERLAIRC